KEVKKNDTAFIENKIRKYYDTIPSTIRFHQRILISRDSTNSSHQTSTPSTLRQYVGFIDTTTIPPNAKSQHIVAEKINSAAKSLAEYQRMKEIATDDSMKVLLSSKIIKEQKNISIQNAQPEYFIGTSSTIHIVDLESIISNEEFSTTLKKEVKVRPIWILLVDGGPNENSKHMKNIIQYAHLFHALELNYLTICTHTPDQSAYNLVECSMASLFAKLAVITLPVGEFGSHLNSQEKVVDEVLAQ
ncbi:6770_t:CDS:2, partial [Funneliformis geosporum]